MRDVLRAVIVKYDMPRPISGQEAIGKTVAEITSGTWINESLYVIFTDNTCIAISQYHFGDSHETYIREPHEYDDDYMADLGYSDTSKYHAAYKEYNSILNRLKEQEQEHREKDELKRLQEKYAKEDTERV